MSAVLFGLSVAVAAVLLSLEHSERTEVQDKDAINSLLYAIMKWNSFVECFVLQNSNIYIYITFFF